MLKFALVCLVIALIAGASEDSRHVTSRTFHVDGSWALPGEGPEANRKTAATRNR